MKLTAEVRKSFEIGKFEEFVDRAEDQLKDKFIPLLPRLGSAPGNAWRDIVRDSYEITKSLNRPSAKLTLIITKARIPLGAGVFTDHRFANLSRAITKLAQQTSLDEDPVEDFLDRSQAFWQEDRLEARKNAFQSLFTSFERHKSADELLEFLSADEQTHALYAKQDVHDQFGKNMKDAKRLGITADTDLFRYMLLVDCYGPHFHKDPFYPDLSRPIREGRGLQAVLDNVAETTQMNIRETNDGRK